MNRQPKFVKGFVRTKKLIKPASEPQHGPSLCLCQSRLHPLNLKSPNCLKCGFVVCTENSGFCPSCRQPLVVETAVQENAEFQAANRNLARLLSYQRSGAVRTMIHDEVADFDSQKVQTVGQWGTKEEQEAERRMRERQWQKNEEKEKRRNGRGSRRMAFDIGLNRMVEVEDEESEESEKEEEKVYGYDSRYTDNATSTPPSSTADPEINSRQRHHKKQLIVPKYKTAHEQMLIGGKSDVSETRLQIGDDYANDMALEV